MESSDPRDDHPTRRLDDGSAEPGDRTVRLEGDARAGGEQPRPAPGARRTGRRRGRDILIGLLGALVGFVLALVLVALGTSGPAADDRELAAAQERIEALESELAERDARIAELESRLAEAEAAAGERAADVEAQRQALDDRAAALDERARALEEREAALDRRAAELDQRERELAEREPGDEPDGIELPGIDEEAASTIIERVLEQLRDLFQGNGS